MAEGNEYEIWTCFVEADYLIEAKTYEGKCPTCNSPKDCNNYYCLQCKLGGLCPTAFRGNGAHIGHHWLQVHRQSHKSAVDPRDLAKYLPRESIKHIQKCLLNNGSLCYLRTNHYHASSSSRPHTKRAKTSRGTPSLLKSCKACDKVIANSQDCQEDFLLYSVECLITLAQRQPERNLLQMLDGALAPTNEFPQTALEKIKGKLTESNSKSYSKTLVVIDDHLGSSSGGEIVAKEPHTIRGSAGRRSARVNYQELYRGGTRTGTAIAARTQVGATTPTRIQETSGGSSRRGPTNRTQATPDYSANPLGHQSAGLHHLVVEVQAIGDWDLYLENLGRN